MPLISSQDFKDILIGVFMMSLYIQTSFRIYLYASIGFAYLAFSGSTGIDFKPPYNTIIPATIFIVLAAREYMRLKKSQDQDVTRLLPSKANKIFGAFLMLIYVLLKIFYFDRV